MDNVYETYSKKYFQNGGEFELFDYFILFLLLVFCILLSVAAADTRKKIDNGDKSTLTNANYILFIFLAVVFGLVFAAIIVIKKIR